MNRTTIASLRPGPGPRRRRGVAMLLVLGVVVVASVLGYAMLSSAAMTKQSSRNSTVSAAAQSVAESGLNLAIYYLQKPHAAPGYPAYPTYEQYERDGDYWRGTNGQWVDLASPSVGQVQVKVTRPDVTNRWRYRIESIGRMPGSSLERRVQAETNVHAEFRFDHALVTNQDLKLGNNRMIVEGHAYSNAGLSLTNGAAVTRKGIRRKLLSSSSPGEGWAAPSWLTPDRAPQIIPRFDEIRSYLTYQHGGQTYQARVLSTTNLGTSGIAGLGAQGVRLEPTSDNPAGIYYAPGDLTMHKDSEVLGTLIVRGNLTTQGDNVRIRAQPGYPALLVGGNLHFGGLLTLMPRTRVEGVTYVGGKVDGGLGLAPQLEVDGAMLVAGTTPIFPSLPLASLLRVRHDPDLTRLPDFSDVGRTPISIEVVDWDAQ